MEAPGDGFLVVVIKTVAPQHNADSDAQPIGPLELFYEGISTLKKETVALYPICIDKGLSTAHCSRCQATYGIYYE